MQEPAAGQTPEPKTTAIIQPTGEATADIKSEDVKSADIKSDDEASVAVSTATIAPDIPIAPLPLVKTESGWTRYRNDVAGFEISIPSGSGDSEGGGLEARIQGEVIPGIADGFKPAAISPEEYSRRTRQAYGDRLCTWIYYQRASIVIQSRKAIQEMGQSCFDWGKGQDTLQIKKDKVTIDGVNYEAGGALLFDQGGRPYLLLMMVSLPGGDLIAYSSGTESADEYQDYLNAHTHEKVLEIIQTYHAFAVQSTPAVPTDTPPAQ